MAEPFKNHFDRQMITGMAGHFQHHWSEFDADDFTQAGEILLASLSPAREDDIFSITVDEAGIAGWAIMPMAHYVGLRGQVYT